MRFIKFLFYVSLFGALGTSLWFAFGIWSGMYSVYSYPPSKDDLEGSTLIIKRDDGEPMYNSPHYKPPKEKPQEKKTGLGFGKLKFKSMKPIQARTILKLPYVEWAYNQSLITESTDTKPRK